LGSPHCRGLQGTRQPTDPAHGPAQEEAQIGGRRTQVLQGRVQRL
jgi:hypothetical protein